MNEATITPLDPAVPAQPLKPGWQTSEAWGAGITILSALAVQLGVINSADMEGVSKAMTIIVASVVSAGTAIAYLVNRFKLKTKHIDSEVAVATAGTPDPKATIP
jgi:hypothetical protein